MLVTPMCDRGHGALRPAGAECFPIGRTQVAAAREGGFRDAHDPGCVDGKVRFTILALLGYTPVPYC